MKGISRLLFAVMLVSASLWAQVVQYHSNTSGNTILVELRPNDLEMVVTDKDAGVMHLHFQKIDANSGGMFFSNKEKSFLAVLSKDTKALTFSVVSSGRSETYFNVGTAPSTPASPGGSASNERPQVKPNCYACFGTGICRVCRGTGTYSNYGYSSQCKACGGTGKCHRCHGTGKEA